MKTRQREKKSSRRGGEAEMPYQACSLWEQKQKQQKLEKCSVHEKFSLFVGFSSAGPTWTRNISVQRFIETDTDSPTDNGNRCKA